MELLTVSVGHLLDWNNTFSALAFRASWITGKLFYEKRNVIIRTLQRRFTNMPDIMKSGTATVRRRG